MKLDFFLVKTALNLPCDNFLDNCYQIEKKKKYLINCKIIALFVFTGCLLYCVQQNEIVTIYGTTCKLAK